MSYCPKCHMEFVEGITVCSDCKGPLVESEQAARALEEEATRQMTLAGTHMPPPDFEQEDDPEQETVEEVPHAHTIYTGKAQRYQDLKSSASAFFLVGGLLSLLAISLWLGIIKLPVSVSGKYLMQTVLTVMALVFLAIAIRSRQAATQIEGGIQEENEKTKALIQWFLDTYQAKQLDANIHSHQTNLQEGELSLQRFQLIQDYLITAHDLTDQGYVDYLVEEIYSRLYEEVE